MKIKNNKILIIGINYSPELTGIGKYTGEMVEWLAENGYECTVITSFPYYPNWKVQLPYSGNFYKTERYKDGKITVHRCPLYVPVIPSGLKRIIHEASFFSAALLKTMTLLFSKKHSHVFCIAPPFHLGFIALFYRLLKGGKINYHIQDLQIEAARDLKVVESKFVFKILFSLEKFILKRVDTISSISAGMILKIQNKSERSILNFPNWVDTAKFFPLENKGDLKINWGYKTTDKIVLYSGSIGEKQGLEALIDIAEICMADENIQFIICGNGPYKKNLELITNNRGVSNLKFLPLQEFNVFNEFLNLADVHLVLQKAEASDLVMPSKLTTILSAGGLLIATAMEGTSLYNEISNHDMGLVIPPEDNIQLLKAIQEACTRDYSSTKINARKYAEAFLNKHAILFKMKETIL